MALSELLRQDETFRPREDDVTPQRKFGGSDLATGAELGLRGAQSGYYNLPVVGDPNAAAYAEAQAAGVPVQFRSSEDVDFLNPSQVIDYAQQNIGQLGVSTLPTLVGGGLGAGLARTIMGRAAEGLTKAELARRAATIGNAARGGAVAAGTGQAYGDMAAELRSQGLEPGAATGLLALGSGIGNAFGLENAFKSLVASAGEDAVQAATRSRLASVAIGAGQGALKTGGIETATEVGDEALAIANRAYYDPAYREKTDDMWGRVKETAIATMAGTGLMGGAAGSVGGLRSPTPGAPNENTQVPPAASSAATDTSQMSGQARTVSPEGGAVPPTEDVRSAEPRSLLERVGGEPAPTHDMSLDELRAMDSSTSPGETYGESQNATKEVPVQTDATGQRQEVLKPAGASAPAPVPTIDLTKRQPDSFKVTGPAAARDPSLSKTDPRLVEILRVAAETSPEFKAEIFSGIRKINPKHPNAIQHPDGAALDTTLIDRKTGKRYDGNYQDSKTFDIYERFAQHAKRVQMQLYPELNDTFTWGGYFSGPKGKYGAVDLMHFDLRSRGAHAAAGGDWATGLTPAQRKLFPGAKSQGMGDITLPSQPTGEKSPAMPAYESPFEVDKDGKYYGYYKPRGITGGLLSDPKFLKRIDEVEAKHGIPSGTLQAIMAKESNGNPEAVSPADDQGLHGWGIGQFRNATARGLAKQTGIPIWDGNKVNMDPYVQVEAMGELLSRKRKSVGGDWDDAAWAYNAGEKNVLDYKQSGKYSQFASKVDPKYKKEVVANRDAILRARGVQPARNQQLSEGERQELSRRKTAGEPTYQETDLGRAYKTGMLEPDPEKVGEVDRDDPFNLTGTSEGFELTFKGRKYDSTGDDLMRPARPTAEPEADTFEGITQESTPIRAFSEVMYPGAKVEVVGEKDNINRKVSVVFPEDQRDALGENQKSTAGEILRAFVSGKKDGQEKKILLEHPSIVGKDSGNPIEIPITKEGLARIGRALDPGAYDSAPSASHAAAMSGLTHLIYDKGFVPRGLDLSKLEDATSQIKSLTGRASDSDRLANWIFANFEQEEPSKWKARAADRPTSSVDPALPITSLVSFPTSVTASTVAANLGIPHTKMGKGGILKNDRPTATIVLGKGETKTDFETYTTPEGEVKQGKPRLTISAADLRNPRQAAETIRNFIQQNNVTRPLIQGNGELATKVLNYALSPDIKPVAPASRSTPIAFASTDTDAGGQLANLTAPVEPRPGTQRVTPVESRPGAPGYALDGERNGAIGQTPVEFSQGYDPVLPAQIPVRAGQQADLGFSGQGFDEGAYIAPLTEMAEGTDPAAEAEPYEAANRLDRVVNRAVTEDKDVASVGARKGETRRGVENTTNKVEDTAKRTRELDSKSIETVHKVSGGATIRATGVSDKVVQFFTNALKDIGLEVPLRVMGKAGITQHLDALQQRIDGLVEAIMREEEALGRMPGVLKEEKKAREEQQKKIQTLRRALQDASTEQGHLLDAQEDAFAARVIYNDHYQDATRRTPTIVISDEAASSPNLTKVLGHELGHVVQRAWFDQLPIDLKTEIMMELSDDFRHLEDWPERFADLFVRWYELNEAGDFNRKQREAYAPGGRVQEAFKKLWASMMKLWRNLVHQDKKFRDTYPKFDEFLRSTVGKYGRMKPINSEINHLWTESLAQPYGGLPLAAADKTKFNDMSPEEYANKVAEGVQAAKDRAAKFVESKVGENVVARDYMRRLGETYDVMKTGAEFLAMSEGYRLRHGWNGIFKGWANIYSPEMGKSLRGMQVISGEKMHTRELTGRLQNLVKRWRARYRQPLVDIQNRVTALTDAERESLLKNLWDENYAAETQLAKDIRKYFGKIWADLKRFDVRVGKLIDYFPKAWNVEMFADPAHKDKIIGRFTELFKSRDELPVRERVRAAIKDADGNLTYEWHDIRYETAEKAAIGTYNRIVRGEVDLFSDLTNYGAANGLRSSAFPNNRPRPFTNKEYRDFNLFEFMNHDINYVMQTYTDQAARRMMAQMATGIPSDQLDARRNPELAKAWKNRFEAAGLDPVVANTPTAALDLLLAEGLKDGRIPDTEYDKAKSLITSSLGMKNVGTSPRLRRWTNRMVAYQTILTMAWSAFSSVSDFGIAGWRGESFSRAGDAFRKLLDKTTRQQQEELLKVLGLAMDETTRHALQSDTVMVNDPMARGSHKAMEIFFRLNQMERLSHSNMIFSSLLGQSYIKDYSEQAVNGATPEIRDAAMKRLNLLHPNFNPVKALTKDFESDPMMQTALMEFISQSHLHDQQGYTPEYFQDYRFRLLTMLKGFTFKYHNIVLKQLWERMKDQPDLLHAAMPVMALAVATMPLALLGMETKDFLRRRLPTMLGAPKLKRQKEKSASEKLHDVIMASGMPGVYVSMFDDMLEAPKHGQPGIIALMGPAVGTVYNASARTADEYLPGMTPGVAYFPWLRATARQGLRDTFGFGVRDEEE